MNRSLCLLAILLGFSCQPTPSSPDQEEEQSRPNILFAIADDASFPHMSAYGCTWVSTPAFDRVAKEGLLFTRAYTPNAKCAPSRACILTGRNSWQLEAAVNHWCYFPPKFTTYPEALTEAGYHVGYTTKGWAPGRALDEAGNRRQMTGTPYNLHQLTPPAEHISNNDYAANFASFLDSTKTDQPFCFWYGSIEPHRAYEFGAGLKHGKQLEEVEGEVFPFWPDNEAVKTDLLDYAFELEYFDQHLGKMLDELEQRGLLDNTIVVVTSDNGMPFPRVKGQAYELSNHLPLAIMWPKGIEQPGRTIEEFVNFIDFAPTFLEYAGLSESETNFQPITGQSLRPFFEAQADAQQLREHVLIGKERHDIGRPNDGGYPIRGLVSKDYLYLRNYEPERWPAGNPETGYLNTDGSPTKTEAIRARTTPGQEDFWTWNLGKRPAEELYDLRSDPSCMINLATAPEFQSLKADLQQRMEAQLLAEGDPRMQGQGDQLEAYPYAGENHRGFYERYMAGEKLKAGWVNESDFGEKLD
ncbi:MAG: sulfatase [Bacteroidota bacterium]